MGNKAPKKTPAEIAKESKRLINRSLRHLERERNKLEKEEPKILSDIKRKLKYSNCILGYKWYQI